MSGYREEIAPKAFTRTLSQRPGPDVVLLQNHTGPPLARTSSGTMSLQEDQTGLLVNASLDPGDPEVAALRGRIGRGDISEMSFAFKVTDREWNRDFTVRLIRAVDINRGDVSVVSGAANPWTSVKIGERLADLTLEQRKRRAETIGTEMRGPYAGYPAEKAHAQIDAECEAKLAQLNARVERVQSAGGADFLATARQQVNTLRASVRIEQAEQAEADTYAVRRQDTRAEVLRLRRATGQEVCDR